MRFETSLIAGTLLAASPLQGAQPLDLSWQAPAGCPQESAVREQIRALVPASMLESGNLKAEGTIARLDKRYRLKLVLTFGDVRGERVIDSDSCGDLAGAAAVALGLLLQSATQPSTTAPSSGTSAGAGASGSPGTGSPPNTSGSAAPATSSQPKPPEVPAPEPSTEPKSDGEQRARRWRIFLQAPELALGVGPLPEPTIGVAFALGVRVRPWSLGVGLHMPHEQRLALPGTSGAGANLDYWLAQAWVCHGWHSASFELAPCLTFGLERLSATGTGSGVSPLSERATWLSVGAAAHGRWYVAEWFALSATAGGRVEGARPTIRIDGLPDYGRLKPAAFTLRAGPVWIF
ncbi:MAG TPA: hypothetical protein VHP33_27285 [Polyangiaceae bacterium]|nr:hypothetical protein [Polyangiaceae bacterium]